MTLCKRVVHGFGIFKDFETNIQPWIANTSTKGWNSSTEPVSHVPNGSWSLTYSLCTKYAIKPTWTKEVGIGKPSKYLDLPVRSFGIWVTVTLNLANLVKPQRTKKDKTKTSIVDWNPMANATDAGATPNEIRSANESNSWPIKEDLFLSLATLPSKKSKNSPKKMKRWALWT